MRADYVKVAMANAFRRERARYPSPSQAARIGNLAGSRPKTKAKTQAIAFSHATRLAALIRIRQLPPVEVVLAHLDR